MSGALVLLGIGSCLCFLLFVVSFVCLYIMQCELPDWLYSVVGILEVVGVMCMMAALILIIFQI